MEEDIGRYVPDLVVDRIFGYLGARDAWAASQICIQWRSIGLAARRNMEVVRVSDFYPDLINEERFIDRPVFYLRDELRGLIAVKDRVARDLIKWLAKLYPNVTELVFRNYLPRIPSTDGKSQPSSFRIFVINSLTRLVQRRWPNLEMLDVSGQVVDVCSLRRIKRWPSFREIRLSGADLSYNMAVSPRHLTTDSLSKTFESLPLDAIRMSNLRMKFEIDFTRMTSFKALNNDSLTTGWLNALLREATNLRSFAIDCKYVHDENIVLMGKLKQLSELELRNCHHVKDFSPLGNAASLRSATIDFGDKGTEEQLCQIVRGSKHWRRIVFNEMVEPVGNHFLFVCAEHFRAHKCPVVQFELNTEKKHFPFVGHDWTLPNADAASIEAVLQVCPWLEILGVCSRNVHDDCLLKVAELCPRVHTLVINDSEVTDEGIVHFYEALRRKRADWFCGAESGGAFVYVRYTPCTPSLVEKVQNLSGGELKVKV